MLFYCPQVSALSSDSIVSIWWYSLIRTSSTCASPDLVVCLLCCCRSLSLAATFSIALFILFLFGHDGPGVIPMPLRTPARPVNVFVPVLVLRPGDGQGPRLISFAAHITSYPPHTRSARRCAARCRQTAGRCHADRNPDRGSVTGRTRRPPRCILCRP